MQSMHQPLTPELANMERFEREWQKHRQQLLGMLERRMDRALRKRLDPEEILDEAYFRARKRWTNLSASGMSEKTWFIRAVLDCYLNIRKHHKAQGWDLGKEESWPPESAMQLAKGIVAKGPGPLSATALLELQRRVRETLARLDEVDRDILTLKQLDQLPYKEIAEVLGISAVAAATRHSRALQRFKELWGND